MSRLVLDSHIGVVRWSSEGEGDEHRKAKGPPTSWLIRSLCSACHKRAAADTRLTNDGDLPFIFHSEASSDP